MPIDVTPMPMSCRYYRHVAVTLARYATPLTLVTDATPSASPAPERHVVAPLTINIDITRVAAAPLSARHFATARDTITLRR